MKIPESALLAVMPVFFYPGTSFKSVFANQPDHLQDLIANFEKRITNLL